MKRALLSWYFGIFSITGLFSQNAQLPEGFNNVRIAEGLDPTTMTIAPDGRVFIAEKNGRILIVQNDQLLPNPFVTIQVDNQNERGLSGIALDPHFEHTHFIYIYYSIPGQNRNRISRLTANGNLAIPGSETILMDLDPMAGFIHNAGNMRFGTDEKLYVATGDGAQASASQSFQNLLGKILRINKDGSIPEDNPFYNTLSGNPRAIYALGLRNPFTIDLSLETGKLFANDVGGSQYEEVNDIQPGKNYGWPVIEGPITSQTPPENYQDPFYYYDHSQGCAITGGSFYEPEIKQFPPEYHGKYFFGDYCQNYIKVLNPETGDVESTFITQVERPIAFSVSKNGAFYYISRGGLGGGSPQDNTSSSNGSLWKVEYTGSGLPYISIQPRSVFLPVGEDAEFSVSASGAGTLNYTWFKDSEVIPNSNDPLLVYPDVVLADNGSLFWCVISNVEGSVTSQEVLLEVTDATRPEPVIESPDGSALYHAGDTLFITGMAQDAQDGQLGPEQLTWVINFHHRDHAHPALSSTSGFDSIGYIIPRIGELDDDVWYRIYLTGTNSAGLTKTTFVEVFPDKTTINYETDPPGLELNVDGRWVTTPHQETSVVGISRTVEARELIILSDQIGFFLEYSTGQTEKILNFNTPVDEMTIIASYDLAPAGDGNGLLGEYFNLTRSFSNTPDLVRIDPEINFDWGEGSPDESLLGNDFFSIRWTGFIKPPLDGTYTFYVESDDGARLWVNNQILIDQWVPQGATEWSGEIDLIGGNVYPLRLLYFEDAGLASVKLSWSSSLIPKDIIRQNFLMTEEITGLNDQELQELEIFPNPSSGKVYLNWNNKNEDLREITIMDSAGKHLLSLKKKENFNSNFVELNLNALLPGMYFIKCTGGNGKTVVQRLIKN